MPTPVEYSENMLPFGYFKMISNNTPLGPIVGVGVPVGDDPGINPTLISGFASTKDIGNVAANARILSMNRTPSN